MKALAQTQSNRAHPVVLLQRNSSSTVLKSSRKRMGQAADKMTKAEQKDTANAHGELAAAAAAAAAADVDADGKLSLQNISTTNSESAKHLSSQATCADDLNSGASLTTAEKECDNVDTDVSNRDEPLQDPTNNDLNVQLEESSPSTEEDIETNINVTIGTTVAEEKECEGGEKPNKAGVPSGNGNERADSALTDDKPVEADKIDVEESSSDAKKDSETMINVTKATADEMERECDEKQGKAAPSSVNGSEPTVSALTDDKPVGADKSDVEESRPEAKKDSETKIDVTAKATAEEKECEGDDKLCKADVPSVDGSEPTDSVLTDDKPIEADKRDVDESSPDANKDSEAKINVTNTTADEKESGGDEKQGKADASTVNRSEPTDSALMDDKPIESDKSKVGESSPVVKEESEAKINVTKGTAEEKECEGDKKLGKADVSSVNGSERADTASADDKPVEADKSDLSAQGEDKSSTKRSERRVTFDIPASKSPSHSVDKGNTPGSAEAKNDSLSQRSPSRGDRGQEMTDATRGLTDDQLRDTDVICGEIGTAFSFQPWNRKLQALIEANALAYMSATDTLKNQLIIHVIGSIRAEGRFLYKDSAANKWFPMADKQVESIVKLALGLSGKSKTANDKKPDGAECLVADNDVLYCKEDFQGSGGLSYYTSHAGNLKFQDLVQENSYAYMLEKAAFPDRNNVVKTVVEAVRASGGRFLEMDIDSGSWRELGDESVALKVNESLRSTKTKPSNVETEGSLKTSQTAQSSAEKQLGDKSALSPPDHDVPSARLKDHSSHSTDKQDGNKSFATDTAVTDHDGLPLKQDASYLTDKQDGDESVAASRGVNDHEIPSLNHKDNASNPDDTQNDDKNVAADHNVSDDDVPSVQRKGRDSSRSPRDKQRSNKRAAAVTAAARQGATHNDVLSARRSGHIYASHPGNKMFQAQIVENYREYSFHKVGSKSRMRIVQKVIEDVRARGGRFVTLDSDSGSWVEMREGKVVGKVQGALSKEVKKAKKAGLLEETSQEKRGGSGEQGDEPAGVDSSIADDIDLEQIQESEDNQADADSDSVAESRGEQEDRNVGGDFQQESSKFSRGDTTIASNKMLESGAARKILEKEHDYKLGVADSDISDLDVLSAHRKGHIYASHPGNKKFQALIQENCLAYSFHKVGSKNRMLVVQKVIYEVRASGGRFLMLDSESGSWVEMGEGKVVGKVQGALSKEGKKTSEVGINSSHDALQEKNGSTGEQSDEPSWVDADDMYSIQASQDSQADAGFLSLDESGDERVAKKARHARHEESGKSGGGGVIRHRLLKNYDTEQTFTVEHDENLNVPASDVTDHDALHAHGGVLSNSGRNKSDPDSQKVQALICENTSSGDDKPGLPSSNINDYDVLCTHRGGQSNRFRYHIGNLKLQALVHVNSDAYAKARVGSKTRTDIVSKMVNAVRNNGGRFLVTDINSNLWHELPEVEVERKLQNALSRDKKKPSAAEASLPGVVSSGSKRKAIDGSTQPFPVQKRPATVPTSPDNDGPHGMLSTEPKIPPNASEPPSVTAHDTKRAASYEPDCSPSKKLAASSEKGRPILGWANRAGSGAQE